MVFGDVADRMLDIADCESGRSQFRENGMPKVSPTNDWGYFQINKKTWHDTATQLGLDYQNNVYHNIFMAYYVYKVQGIDGWTCNKLVYGGNRNTRKTGNS